MAHGFSSLKVCRLLPDKGWKLCLLNWQTFLTTEPTGKFMKNEYMLIPIIAINMKNAYNLNTMKYKEGNISISAKDKV